MFEVYGGYVATWGFLISYLLVVIATPIWLYRIKALTPLRLVVSSAATLALGYVIFSNFYPVPEFPFNILPFIYGGILLVGLVWYWYLEVFEARGRQAGRHNPDPFGGRAAAPRRCRHPRCSSRAGGRRCPSSGDDDPEPQQREKEPVAP